MDDVSLILLKGVEWSCDTKATADDKVETKLKLLLNIVIIYFFFSFSLHGVVVLD